MVSSVSSTQLQQVFSSPSARQNPQPAASQPETPKDSVQLSAAAKKALSGGDVDHDGDSH